MKLVSFIRHLQSFLFLACFCIPLLAQLPSGSMAKDWPSKYIKPKIGVDLAPAPSDEVFEGFAWQVYSDRSNNQTTSAPNGGVEIARLGFLEALYVLEERGEYLRVVKDPDLGLGDDPMKFSKKAKDFGWIHKNKLLLWSHCLQTPDKSQINKKAMILNTLETLDDKKNKFDDLAAQEVKFHLSPNLNSPGSRSAGLFNVFFIYKIDQSQGKESVLLGREVRAQTGERIGNSISGWVPMSRVVQWDHRVALEPNWTQAAAIERTQTDRSVKFFANRQAALTYQIGGNPKGKDILWNDDPLEERNLWGMETISGPQ